MESTRTIVLRGLVIASVAGIIFYTIFAMRGYLFGPSLSVTFPKNGATVPEGLVVIQGESKRLKTLTVNQQAVAVQKDGTFSFPLVVFPPYTILDVLGTDTFGKQTQVTIELNVQ